MTSLTACVTGNTVMPFNEMRPARERLWRGVGGVSQFGTYILVMPSRILDIWLMRSRQVKAGEVNLRVVCMEVSVKAIDEGDRIQAV